MAWRQALSFIAQVYFSFREGEEFQLEASVAVTSPTVMDYIPLTLTQDKPFLPQIALSGHSYKESN